MGMNKPRLIRTIAFLLIGLAAVAAASAILAGADIALAGGPGLVTASARGTGFGSRQAEAVAAVPGVTAVSALTREEAAVSYQGRGMRAEVAGVDSALPPLIGLRLLEGRFILRGDCEGRRRVCVITGGMRDALFGGKDPIGELLRIEGTLYRVAGCVDAAAMEVFIPYTSAQALFGDHGFDELIAEYAVSPRMRDAGVFVSGRIAGILRWSGADGGVPSLRERGGFFPLSRSAANILASCLFAAGALFLVLAAGRIRSSVRREPA
jgi:hypothetical protein